jgi:hypothetical protein
VEAELGVLGALAWGRACDGRQGLVEMLKPQPLRIASGVVMAVVLRCWQAAAGETNAGCGMARLKGERLDGHPEGEHRRHGERATQAP